MAVNESIKMKTSCLLLDSSSSRTIVNFKLKKSVCSMSYEEENWNFGGNLIKAKKMWSFSCKIDLYCTSFSKKKLSRITPRKSIQTYRTHTGDKGSLRQANFFFIFFKFASIFRHGVQIIIYWQPRWIFFCVSVKREGGEKREHEKKVLRSCESEFTSLVAYTTQGEEVAETKVSISALSQLHACKIN